MDHRNYENMELFYGVHNEYSISSNSSYRLIKNLHKLQMNCVDYMDNKSNNLNVCTTIVI